MKENTNTYKLEYLRIPPEINVIFAGYITYNVQRKPSNKKY